MAKYFYKRYNATPQYSLIAGTASKKTQPATVLKGISTTQSVYRLSSSNSNLAKYITMNTEGVISCSGTKTTSTLLSYYYYCVLVSSSLAYVFRPYSSVSWSNVCANPASYDISYFNSYTAKISSYSQGTYVDEIIAEEGIYPDNGHYAEDGYWYVRGEVPIDITMISPISHVLPVGYKQVDYIESSGTQYINTGFMPNQDTRVIADAQYIKSKVSAFLFGTRTSNFTVNYNILLTGTNNVFRSDYNDSKIEFSSISPTERFIFDKNKSVCTINNISINNATSTFSTTFPLFLFAVNENGTAKYQGCIRLYSCQIYDNDTLVRDYVPVINSSGVAGLWDYVTGTFYDNKGTGTFTAGRTICELPAEYTQLDYIASSGTQYINTGVKATNNTQLTIGMQATSMASTWNGFWGARDANYVNNFSLFADGTSSHPNQFYGHVGIYDDSYYFSTEVTPLNYNTIDTKNNVMKIGNLSYTFTSRTIAATTPITLFGANDDGTLQWKSSLRIYYCRIYNGTTCIRDFIPAKDSNDVLGLYDIVNDVFYTNNGTGTFIAGEEFKIKYPARIKKSGIWMPVETYKKINGIWVHQPSPSLILDTSLNYQTQLKE